MSAPTVKQRLRQVLPRPIVKVIDAVLNPPPGQLRNHRVYVDHVAGRKGIEIGGPSAVFRTVMPVYPHLRELDGVNFACDTVWEGRLSAGHNFHYLPQRTGYQYIADATDLAPVQSASYDVVLSSNCLEHVANPLKALLEWKRVLRPDGSLILVLPDKASNFDHRRPTTPFEHILEDFKQQTSERDLTHLEEILALHDRTRDPASGTAEAFMQRSLDNFDNRTLHHHVFDAGVMRQMLNHVGFDVIQADRTRADFLALATCRRGGFYRSTKP